MRAIYSKECKLNRKMTILWTSIIAVMILFFAAEYPMVAGNVDQLDAIMDIMPPVMGIMMGIYPEVSIGDPVGFFYCLFLWCAIVANFYAATLGVNLPAMDEKRKTAEFLYTKPFSRSQVIRAKIWAGITNLAAMTVVAWIMLLVFMNVLVGAGGLNGGFTLCMLGLFGSEMVFFSMGLTLAAITQKSESAMRLSLLNVLLSYVLSVVIKTMELDMLTFLCPFWYFNAPSVMTGEWNPLYLPLSVLIVASCVFTAHKRYGLRDF